MKKKVKVPSLVTLAILTLFTVVFWVGFDLYHAFQNKPDPEVEPKVLEPINPVINQDALNQLQQTLLVSQSEINSYVPATNVEQAQEVVTQIPTPEPTPQTEPLSLEGSE